MIVCKLEGVKTSRTHFECGHTVSWVWKVFWKQYLHKHISQNHANLTMTIVLVIQTGSWTGVCKVSRLCHWYSKTLSPELRLVPVLWVPGNIVYNNSNNMYMCICMYRKRKRETRNSGRESKSQSFRWSFRVNEQETRVEIEGNGVHWLEKNHSKRIFLTASHSHTCAHTSWR